MAIFQAATVRNRLLAMLAPDDFALLEPKLERVPLDLDTVVIEANQPIQHVVFPESGIVSTVRHLYSSKRSHSPKRRDPARGRW